MCGVCVLYVSFVQPQFTPGCNHSTDTRVISLFENVHRSRMPLRRNVVCR